MGVAVKISGKYVPVEAYRVSESSMPLAGGDSSGAIGTIDLDLTALPELPAAVNMYEPVEFLDTNRGSTRGTIRALGTGRAASSQYTVTADTRLGEFNIEGQVQPFSGTLNDAFTYYCSLANIISGIVIDPAIASRQVNFIGWSGNLWTHMKMMATAQGVDLNLISNNVVLRPIRKFNAITDRDTDSSTEIDGTQLALKQEVIWYDTKYVNRGLIWPAGGWTSDVKVLNVNAGEVSETKLDTNSSIFSIEQPVCVEFVDRFDSANSVYTVSGDDGIVIKPAQWAAYGGSLSVTIDPDTQNLTVRIVGATGLYQANGEPMRNFRIGLSAGTSSSDTYSTLRIVGRHVQTNQKSIIIPTGVPDWRTGQEFAPTIDNPFLNNLSDAYSAGARGARRYTGRAMSLSATVVALNRRGQTGTANYPPYSYAQGLWATKTYAQVKASLVPKLYSDVQDDFYAVVQDSFDNQVFGNAPGARIWDRTSARWYRVRDTTTEWGEMSVRADDDTTNGDIQAAYAGKLYSQVKASYAGNTYMKANLRGVL